MRCLLKSFSFVPVKAPDSSVVKITQSTETSNNKLTTQAIVLIITLLHDRRADAPIWCSGYDTLLPRRWPRVRFPVRECFIFVIQFAQFIFVQYRFFFSIANKTVFYSWSLYVCNIISPRLEGKDHNEIHTFPEVLD